MSLTQKPKNNKKVIVTGAGGYIGGTTCLKLKQEGYDVIGVDRNFSLAPWTMQFCDVVIQSNFEDLLIENTPLADAVGVVHIAGTSLVGPSVTDPATYYSNNVGATAKLIKNLANAGFKGNFIFSSSAATYGEPVSELIPETDPLNPISPYGQSKAMAEVLIKDSATAYGFNAACLRYFNACGAEEHQQHGQVKGATHLIARVCESVLKKSDFTIYGTDYPTTDGTCIRDYLHVCDIAEAHVVALEKLNKTFDSYNLGTGAGWSVKEVVDHFKEVTHANVSIKYGPRRPGDPAILIANGNKFKSEFDWKPSYSRLDCIIGTAWAWYNSQRYLKK